MSGWGTAHIGRSWDGHPLEDRCPCPKQPCGLVKADERDPSCEEHSGTKTIRQTHDHAACPAREPVPDTQLLLDEQHQAKSGS